MLFVLVAEFFTERIDFLLKLPYGKAEIANPSLQLFYVRLILL